MPTGALNPCACTMSSLSVESCEASHLPCKRKKKSLNTREIKSHLQRREVITYLGDHNHCRLFSAFLSCGLNSSRERTLRGKMSGLVDAHCANLMAMGPSAWLKKCQAKQIRNYVYIYTHYPPHSTPEKKHTECTMESAPIESRNS